MDHKHGINLHWGLLLAVYWSILFASAMVSLTADVREAHFLLLLIAGIPIYFLASHAIMHGVSESEEHEAQEVENLISFPARPGLIDTRLSKTSAEATRPTRKAG